MFINRSKSFHCILTLLMFAGLLFTLGASTGSTSAALLAPVSVTVTLTDGFGHAGMPLSGTVTVNPGGTIYNTDPFTGQVVLNLEQDTAYILTAASTGYVIQPHSVKYTAASASETFAMQPDTAACPIGYKINPTTFNPLNENFDGAFLPAGWSQRSTGGFWIASTDGRNDSAGSAYHPDSGARVYDFMASLIITVPFDGQLTFYRKVSQLGQNYMMVYLGNADGSNTIFSKQIYDPTVANTWEKVTIDLSAYVGAQKTVNFQYLGRGELWVDDISLTGNSPCDKVAGGKVLGYVTDSATTDPISGATVSGSTYTATSASDGFFTIWQPAGDVTLTAGAAGYVNLPADVSVTADAVTQQDFALEEDYALTVTHTGNGSVTVDPEGPYVAGTEVTLTPEAGPASYFDGWSGDGINDTNRDDDPLTLTINSDMAIEAAFALSPIKVTVSLTDGAGHSGMPLAGTVTVNPGGAVHQADPSTGQVTLTLDQDTDYTLTAASLGYISQTRPVNYTGLTAEEEFELLPNPAACPIGYTAGTAQETVNPLSEGFESGTFPPTGWTNTVMVQGDPGWVASTNAYAGSGSAYHGEKLYVSDWLSTPAITIPNNAQFRFYQKVDDTDGTRKIGVYLQDPVTSTSYTLLEIVPAPSAVNTWQLATVSIPSQYWGQTKKFFIDYWTPDFPWSNQGIGSIWIDDISVTATNTIPVCNAVAGGRVVGYVTDSVTDGPISGATVGDGTVSATTDSTGFYSLWLPAGDVDLTAKAAVHFDLTTILAVAADAITQQDFALDPSYTLTIAANGGSVTRSKAGPYHLNETVTLTAVPDSLHHFNSWGGDIRSDTETVDVIVTGNMTVTAQFDPYEADLKAEIEFAMTGVSTFRYTINVTNLGPDPAHNARVEDDFSDGITQVTWTCTAANGAACPNASGAGDIDETIATLPANGSLTYIVDAMMVNWRGEQNVVTVYAPAGVVDPVDANNWAAIKKYLIDLPMISK